MVYGLIESSNLGLGHPVVLSTLAVGVVTLIAFIFVEAQSGTNDAAHSVSFADFQRGKLLTFLYAALGGALFFSL